jgi:hypothetical protein
MMKMGWDLIKKVNKQEVWLGKEPMLRPVEGGRGRSECNN